jgi:hypothetical protein
MAACPSCGASVSGDLCPKCGALVNSGQIPPGKSSKRRTVYWIIGGCLGLILIAVLLLVGGSIYFFHKTGLNTELLSKGPANATAQVMTRLNPKLEIVSVDESTGLIRIRDKSSGRIMRITVKDGHTSRPIYEDDSNVPPPPPTEKAPE